MCIICRIGHWQRAMLFLGLTQSSKNQIISKLLPRSRTPTQPFQQSLIRQLSSLLLDYCFNSLFVFFKAHSPAPRTYVSSNTTHEGVLGPNWASLQWADWVCLWLIPWTAQHRGAGWLSHNICSIWKFYLKLNSKTVTPGSLHSSPLAPSRFWHSWALLLRQWKTFISL